MFVFIKFFLSVALSQTVGAEKRDAAIEDPDTAPLLGSGSGEVVISKKGFFASKLPNISQESKLDSFASGLVPL